MQFSFKTAIMPFILSFCLLSIQVSADNQAPRKALKIDYDKSSIYFVVQAVGYEVKGVFEKFDGTIEINPENAEDLKVQVEVDIASINTGNEFGDTIREARI